MEENKNKQKIKYIVIMLLLIVIFALTYIFLTRKATLAPETPVRVVDTTQDVSGPGVYEDQVIKLSYPEGWKKQEVNEPVKTAVLNKKNYTLVVATDYLTKSNIDPAAVSALVSTIVPWLPQENATECLKYLEDETKEVGGGVKLHNLYFNSNTASPEIKKKCGNPTMGGVLWYGSYFGQNREYFIGPDLSHQIFAAVVYHTDAADKLPYKGDANLSSVLKEAAEMVKNIEYKK
jgi:biopolymer transport protein ExbD